MYLIGTQKWVTEVTEVQSMQSEEPQQKETDQEQEPLLDTVESVSLDIQENPEAFGRSK